MVVGLVWVRCVCVWSGVVVLVVGCLLVVGRRWFLRLFVLLVVVVRVFSCGWYSCVWSGGCWSLCVWSVFCVRVSGRSDRPVVWVGLWSVVLGVVIGEMEEMIPERPSLVLWIHLLCHQLLGGSVQLVDR